VITAITPSAGVARMGSVYSKTLYDPSKETDNTTHHPNKIQVRVTKNGAAKASCSVVWRPTSGTASGWVFPDSTVTDANGYVSAWWVAGTSQNQSVNVSIQQTDGVIKSATITGTAYGHTTRANSIHVSWRTPAWDKFKADVTPQTWAPTTFYEVIGFNGGYGGIQSTQTLFSIWDVGGVSPVVIDPGISKCSNFGGEGTGIKCEAPITPKVNVTYRFELETASAEGGKQDYTMYFTDMSNNIRKKLATLRVPSVLAQSGGDGFVEDWYTVATSCLNNAVRAAKYSNVWYSDKTTHAWVNITSAEGAAVYTPNHNEICVNYNFDFGNGIFNLSTGGMNIGYPLNMPGSTKQYPAAPGSSVVPNGYYKLINTGSAMALDVTGGSTTHGTNIEIWSDNAGAAQVWRLTEIRTGVYTLVNPKSGMALDVTGGAIDAGTKLEIWEVNGGAAQDWEITQVRAGVFKLINPASKMALNVAGGGVTAGTLTNINAVNGSAAQEWKIIPIQ
jgi:hypothetical protein